MVPVYGKTFMSNCIANEILKKGKTVLYQTAPVMLDTIIDYRFNKGNISRDFYDNILNVDLLIIDDLGTETINNMKFTELFNIINTRLLNCHKQTKTIISTNLSLDNLFSTYDERIVSRIVGNYDICYFFGDDIRFKKKRSNGTGLIDRLFFFSFFFIIQKEWSINPVPFDHSFLLIFIFFRFNKLNTYNLSTITCSH